MKKIFLAALLITANAFAQKHPYFTTNTLLKQKMLKLMTS